MRYPLLHHFYLGPHLLLSRLVLVLHLIHFARKSLSCLLQLISLPHLHFFEVPQPFLALHLFLPSLNIDFTTPLFNVMHELFVFYRLLIKLLFNILQLGLGFLFLFDFSVAGSLELSSLFFSDIYFMPLWLLSDFSLISILFLF